MWLIITNSGSVKKTKGEWLPGGILSCFGSKWVNYIEKVDKDVNGQ